MKDTMKDIDIKIATEIAKATVHEMAELRDTKTNKMFHLVAMIIMSIICIVCIVFTSFVGLELIDFMKETEIVVETESDNFTAESDNGNANNVYNSNSGGSTINIGDK